jgi:hypothetical protein
MDQEEIAQLLDAAGEDPQFSEALEIVAQDEGATAGQIATFFFLIGLGDHLPGKFWTDLRIKGIEAGTG